MNAKCEDTGFNFSIDIEGTSLSINIEFIENSIDFIYPEKTSKGVFSYTHGIIDVYASNGPMGCVVVNLSFKAKLSNGEEYDIHIVAEDYETPSFYSFNILNFFGKDFIKSVFSHLGCDEEFADDVAEALETDPHKDIYRLYFELEKHEEKAADFVSDFISDLEQFIYDSLRENIKVALAEYLGIESFEEMFEEFYPREHGDPEEKLPAIRSFLEEHKDELYWADDFLRKYSPRKMEKLIEILNEEMAKYSYPEDYFPENSYFLLEG